MADSMNFGPEWLRNLSSEGTTTGAPKYQLAEYRYGREEMLALCDQRAKPPDYLSKLHGLYLERAMAPVTVTPMTEDETRLWNRGINSEAVLRQTGKLPAGGPPGIGRGRGTSVDRGRGRGRGSGFYYNRPGYEEGELGAGKDGERNFMRTSRSFDRSQSERGWPERNGGDPGDWNGSTSPRKEYGGMMRGERGGSNANDSWRQRSRGGPEEEEGGGGGWRQREKWTRSTSWREESGGDGIPDQSGKQSGPGGRSSNWGRGWVDEGLRGRDEHEGHNGRRSQHLDEVPEWATVDSHEPSGSFDASGAFHGGGFSDEEEQGPIEGHRRSEGGRYRLNSEGQEQRKQDIKRRPPEHEAPSEQVRPGLSRSKTAAELNPPASSSAISKSASSAALSDAQSFDRIRAQHQNFITKPESESSSARKETLPQPKSPQQTQQAPSPEQKSLGRTKEVKEVPRQGSEDDMSRLAVDSVVRLIEEEEKPAITMPSEKDMWYYRDPRGNEQGPFPSTDMYNWFSAGYFHANLLVRRSDVEQYTTLGDLMRLHNTVPFYGPPIAANVPHTPAAEPNVHFMTPMMNNVKMSENELWKTMSQNQRDSFTQRMLLSQQHMLGTPNSMAHLFAQYQQQQAQSKEQPVPDPVQMMMLGNMLNQQAALPHLVPTSIPHPLQLNSVLAASGDPKTEEMIQMIRKLENAQTHANQQRPVVDSLWSGPGRPVSWANGITPNPLWSTEASILAEQKQIQARMEEERKKTEEVRLREELRKKKEEEDRKKAEEEAKAKREEELRLERESQALKELLRVKNRLENTIEAEGLAQLQQEREQEEREKEAKKRLEEQRRFEELRKQEEALRKKEERERRKEEEREKKRLAEEEKRRLEEERKRAEQAAENERRKQEEAAAAQAAALEQQRRQEEALQCLKQQQMKSRIKPWSQSTLPPSSLTEIQAQEKEKKLLQQQQREQLLMQELAEQQNAQIAAANSNRPNGLNLTWAEQPPVRTTQVKSLEEIQRDEALQSTIKHIEREKLERAQLRESPVIPAIWGATSPWTNPNSSSAPWRQIAAPAPLAAGFWADEPKKQKVKTPTSPIKGKSQVATAPTKKAATTNSKPTKVKAKREEAAIMKLFEPQEDEFTSWCLSALSAFHGEFEKTTFCSFLRDVDNPNEVNDYVNQFLGESMATADFARQFVERRSRWRAAQKANVFEDDMCAPATAVNPAGVQTEAQDIFKKGKKQKKGKMLKVDSRILGFSVTAAQDRINVGERETWDPNS